LTSSKISLIDGPLLSVFTGTSVHGSLISAWPATRFTSGDVMLRLVERWRESGLPVYAQFDNDTRFQGTPRWPHSSLRALQQRSIHYVTEHRLRSAARIDSAPVRRAFPSPWQFDPHAVPRGRLIFLRRTDATGRLRLLGQTWLAATHWIHRLVRCEVDLIHHQIALYALRRRQPGDQPLLATLPYHRPSLLHEEHDRRLFNDH
jgi:hypothetical protein